MGTRSGVFMGLITAWLFFRAVIPDFKSSIILLLVFFSACGFESIFYWIFICAELLLPKRRTGPTL